MEDHYNRQIRIVGKGHAACFERLLQEWYQQESFTDVMLICTDTCPANMENSSHSDIYWPILANRSVLAAASPVFASLLAASSSADEDQAITLVGYSLDAFKIVTEYMYTGCLSFSPQNKDEIEEILRDFQISIPAKAMDFFRRFSALTENACDDKDNHVTRAPSKFKESPFKPKIVSVTSIANNSVTDRMVSTTNRKTLRRKRNDELATNRRPFENRSLSFNTDEVVDSILPDSAVTKSEGSALPTKIRTYTRKVSRNQAKEKTESRSVVLKENNFQLTTSKTEDHLETSMSYIQSRKSATLKRASADSDECLTSYPKWSNIQIDAPVNSGRDLVIEIPGTHLKELNASFLEKEICSTVVPSVTAKSNHDEPIPEAGYNFWRKSARGFVSTFADVPGIFSTYKDTATNQSESNSSHVCNEALKECPVPSYFSKIPTKTYVRSKEKSDHIQRLSVGTLKKENISSVNQVGNKVHITTKGPCLFGIDPTDLYEDAPSASVINKQSISRMILEHNYSCSENVVISDDECNDLGELKEDLEDYRRAMQLAINEQRKQNRLKQKLKLIEKEIETFKEPARRLLGQCKRSADGHLTDGKSHQVPLSKRNAKMVPCDLCNKLVKDSWLKRHKQVQHSGMKPHLCEECGRTFALKGQLRSHQLRQHSTVTDDHLCNVCGKTFRFAHYLRRHMTMHGNEKPYTCPYCDKRFRLQPVLVKHVRIHTGEKPYQCDICGRRFTQRTTYAKHLKLHEKWREMGLTETECIQKERQARRLQCEFCSMTFRLDLFLTLHRAKHTGEIPKLPCPTCHKTYPSIRSLNVHRKEEHPETVYFCQLCPKSFTNKPNFDFHMEKHRNPNAVKKKSSATSIAIPCTCEFCGKQLKSRFALDYHIKGVHLGEKPLKCMFCPKRFAQRPSLDQHMRTHTGERPFKCTQCSSAFKQSQHLAAHMVIHTGERPFICQYCGKSFPHKTTLYTHLRIHTGTRLNCSYCHKVLPSVVQLQRHEENCNQQPSK